MPLNFRSPKISSFLFNCQLSTTSECSGVAACESSITLPASAKASFVSTSSSTGLGGKVACRRESTSTSGFDLWCNRASSSAVMRPRIGHSTVLTEARTGESVTPTQGPTPKCPWWRGAKKCEKGWKWVNVGENPKMPYPQCGRSIKTYTRTNNDAPSITKYGSPMQLDAQVVAVRAPCARTALKAHPFNQEPTTRGPFHAHKLCLASPHPALVP